MKIKEILSMLILTFMAALSTMLISQSACAQTVITNMQDIATLGGDRSSAIDLNDLGQVVGWSDTTSGQQHAFLWTAQGGMVDMDTLNGTHSVASGINNLGQVVGWRDNATGRHAFLWTAQKGMVDLNSFNGAESIASDINDLGQVVGWSGNWVDGGKGHAFIWTDNGGIIDIGTLGGDRSFATNINNIGQVVGYSYTGSRDHAFIWSLHGGMADLGTLNGADGDSGAYAINDIGHVVGWSTLSGQQHAFLWNEQKGMVDLGGSSASDINDVEQVVGTGSGPEHAFLWSDQKGMVDLGTLGGVNSGASAINNVGQAVGWSATSSGQIHAFRTISLGPVHNINKGTNYTTIQLAIDDANIGDEIHVDSGTYYENVNINKRIILIGINNSGMPIIYAEKYSTIMLSENGTIIKGFDIRNFGAILPNASVRIVSNNNTIEDNIVDSMYPMNDNGFSQMGIVIHSNNNNVIHNKIYSNNSAVSIQYKSGYNRIEKNNITSYNGHGVEICPGTIYSGMYSGNNIIRENNISVNNYGILVSKSNNTIEYNDIVSSDRGIGISLGGVADNVVSYNNISRFQMGIEVGNNNSNTIMGNNINSNQIGINLALTDNNTIIGNNISSNQIGIRFTNSDDNKIYNNYLNNILNLDAFGVVYNILNTTKIKHINIIGGPNIGGNYWADPYNTGFSQTCTNRGDGFCNETFKAYNGIDYLPLTSNLVTNHQSPIIESITIFPTNTTPNSIINICVKTSDDVTEVYAGGYNLIKSSGFWNGDITAAATIGNYNINIIVKNTIGGTNEITVPYKVVTQKGGTSMSIIPRTNNIINGNSIDVNIKAKNTQNVDDTFRIYLNVSELPVSYQANLGWFNWTEKVLNIRSGEEIIIPIKISIPAEISGTKMFRTKINSTTGKPYSYDTGALKIT